MNFPFLGFGLGLRTKHYPYILKHWPKIDWFEVISENFMIDGGRPLHVLEQVREHYPVVLHGVSQNLGSTDPLDKAYLKKLKKLIARIKPVWTSDHLCWTGVGGKNLHDLLPLPYTDETIKHVAKRIRQVQDFLGRQILIENVSSYMEYESSSMTEWEFLSAILVEADCKILLDLNNIYVSSVNHAFDARHFLQGIPKDRVVQIHLAGHSNKGKFLLDTHDHPIIKNVWDLYEQALQMFGPVSTMIERDDHIPAFPKLEAELKVARSIYKKIYDINPSSPQTNPESSLEAHYGT